MTSRKSMPERSSATDSPFYVSPILDLLGGLVQRNRNVWLWLGRLESDFLASELRAVAVNQPLYVCGLARSGSTLLHEIIAAHPAVATHRIKDYPMIATPFWWRQATARMQPAAPHERAHRDRVMITSDSPEALEEMLWMAFFPRCHDPAVTNVLTAQDRHPAFEKFYRTHIRKLLHAENALRYVAKANYHVARLAYLVRLFPDAKLILPVRSPASHIASLMRQHEWFSAGHRQHPRSLAYMQRSGHFEFGRDRRPINLGDAVQVRAIQRAWTAGEEVRGWALYWNMVYAYLARVLADDAQVRAATLVVRYEAMCDAPRDTIQAVLDHCGLPERDNLVERFAPTISRPEYYRRSFSADDLAVIHEETADTARRWGYERQPE